MTFWGVWHFPSDQRHGYLLFFLFHYFEHLEGTFCGGRIFVWYFRTLKKNSGSGSPMVIYVGRNRGSERGQRSGVRNGVNLVLASTSERGWSSTGRAQVMYQFPISSVI